MNIRAFQAFTGIKKVLPILADNALLIDSETGIPGTPSCPSRYHII